MGTPDTITATPGDIIRINGIGVFNVMRKVTAAALCLLLGAAILFLGVPRTIAAFAVLPGNQALREIQERKPVGDEDLVVLADSRERALLWAEAGRTWTDLALAQLLRAFAEGETGRHKAELVEKAIASLKSGLRLAPARPHAWTRLAYAQFLAGEPLPTVSATLRMALLTATYEPRLVFARLELCLRAWRYFEPQDRDLILQQVRLAWRTAPHRLVELAQRSGRLGVVRAALSRTPADLGEFEKRLRRSRA